MTMGLQDLMMFRDNLQQPAPTGMDNLRSLQALTMQGMANEDYMNQPMMNTGLMSLPVAQAGFGGFIKSIVRAPAKIVKGVAKGVSGAVKGVAGAVKNIASSPLGQLAIPAAAMFLGPAAFGLGSLSPLAGKAVLAGGATGLTSLLGGAKPGEALKRGILAGGLTYGGGKLFGAGGAAGADKTAGTVGKGTAGISDVGNVQSYGMPYQQVSMVPDSIAQQAAGVGTSQIPGFTGDIGSATYGGVGQAQAVSSALQTPGGIVSQASGINPFQDPSLMKYPGGTVPTGQPTGIIDTIKAAGSTALDKTQEALKAGLQFAQKNPIPTALGGAALLSGLGAGQQIPQDQLSMAGLTPVETDFDKQIFTYRDREGNILKRDEALALIQQASQNVGAGGQKQASGVTYGFERKAQSGGPVDPMLSASGGLIGMMYGGQAMPENNMDVKYKEFSGMVGGEGTGMEDNVYMPIVEGEQGQQVATLAVSPKEYVVDANTMSLLGNGNPDEGAEIMDQTVKDIRKKATGQTKQQKEIDGLAALNRMRRSV